MTEGISEKEMYDRLSFYTLLHAGPSFIHQHDVDAYAAQHAADNSKPITTTFALVGLYLTVEKNYTGKQVQRAHMQLARKRKEWSRFSQPQNTGAFSVFDVMRESPGVHRDQAISQWCSSVWDAWAESHQEIAELVHTELGI
jgi:hypothetical protein